MVRKTRLEEVFPHFHQRVHNLLPSRNARGLLHVLEQYREQILRRIRGTSPDPLRKKAREIGRLSAGSGEGTCV